MIDPTITTTLADNASNDRTDIDDTDAPAPLKERAWAMYCHGHHSPVISEQLGVSQRTIRHWIHTITADLDANHAEQRQHHLLLAVERKRQVAIAAWDGYERAIQLAEGERAHAVQARDDEISTACVRASRQALTTAARYLTVIAANDRELTTLYALHDDHCHQREQEARAEEREQEHERLCRAREREQFERDQARLDRQQEREGEPQPPPWLNTVHLEDFRDRDPCERRPEINAYFAACDAYRAACQSADEYARVLEEVATREVFYGLFKTFPAPSDSNRAGSPRDERPPSDLATLSLDQIAALQARLDAEEAEDELADQTEDEADDAQSELEQHEPGSLPPQGADAQAQRGVVREPDAAAAARSASIGKCPIAISAQNDPTQHEPGSLPPAGGRVGEGAIETAAKTATAPAAAAASRSEGSGEGAIAIAAKTAIAPLLWSPLAPQGEGARG